ncbi:MBL fold metallo-hydrolase [Leisingera methylohalidivorans]|uniref:Metallo-beta-lactamase n=1 Tax=Leisingera methylohalidivorans DSM 14336 TaxID=999552 RepID=V9VUP4_9RHOB|nr:MBL fold metallo-hydrolase [Leisingera methylohalidivorans]AHD01733.1 metallo-beta-lactamase [Leisingera methylohalidivorans DSM 14336]
MAFTRREFGVSAAAGLAVAAVPGWSSAQITLGNKRIATVSDGYLNLPPEFLFDGLAPDVLQQALEQYGLPAGPLTPDVNVTLLREESRVVLFDAGAGPGFQESAGNLPGALDVLGVRPEEVTHVVFTHCHPDHLWGVLDDFDDLLFPRAAYLMGQREWDYWFDPETVDSIGSSRAAMAIGARRRMEQLEDKVQLFRDGEEILPGVAAVATPGHTPGHMSFEVRDGSDGVLVLGDAVGNHHVSFAEPGRPVGADQEPQKAAATRMRLLDQLAAGQMQLIGYHLPGGGIGRAERFGSGYRFVPAA